MNRKVIILGGETVGLQRVVPILRRADVTVEFWDDVPVALSVLQEQAVDLVIARVPLPGVSVEELVVALRGPTAASNSGSLLLLAEADAAPEIAPFLGRGVNRVVSLDAPSDRLLLAVADLLAVTPRLDLRVLVQLSLSIQGIADRALTMTRNLSASGMLIRGGREFPPGSRVRFEITLDNDPVPVRGEAEVVRHTADHERHEGTGLKFISFHGDGQQRLAAYLESG